MAIIIEESSSSFDQAIHSYRLNPYLYSDWIETGTLIGNWKEERDLREATGIGRTAHNFGKQ